MPLSEALALLLPPGQTQQGDDWSMQIVGSVLRLTRERASVPNQGQGQAGIQR